MAYAIYQGGLLLKGATAAGQFRMRGAETEAKAMGDLGAGIGKAAGAAANYGFEQAARRNDMSNEAIKDAGGGLGAWQQSKQTVTLGKDVTAHAKAQGLLTDDQISDGTATVSWGTADKLRRKATDARVVQVFNQTQALNAHRERIEKVSRDIASYRTDPNKSVSISGLADANNTFGDTLDQYRSGTATRADLEKAVVGWSEARKGGKDVLSAAENTAKRGLGDPLNQGPAEALLADLRDPRTAPYDGLSSTGAVISAIALNHPGSEESWASAGATRSEQAALTSIDPAPGTNVSLDMLDGTTRAVTVHAYKNAVSTQINQYMQKYPNWQVQTAREEAIKVVRTQFNDADGSASALTRAAGLERE